MNKPFKNIYVVCLVSGVMLSGCGFNNGDKLSASSDDSLKFSHAKFPSSSFPPDATFPPSTPAPNPVTGTMSSAPTITAAGQTLNNVTSATQGLNASTVQYDKTAGGAVDTANLTLQGATGTTLHNVVASAVATADAVNKGQLDKGLANTSAAMSGLTPNLRSSKAIQVQAAVGGSYQISEDILAVVKMGISTVSGVR